MNRKSWNQFKLLLLCGFVILISQKVRTGSPIIMYSRMVLISVISLISLKIKTLCQMFQFRLCLGFPYSYYYEYAYGSRK